MAIFKRFEVWLLLVLSIAGVGYVLWSDSQPEPNGGSEPDGPGPGSEVAGAENRFAVDRVAVVSEGEDRIIEIQLLGRNETEDLQVLVPPEVRLLAKFPDEEEESEVPSFFLPFDPPPTLEPGGESVVTLRYWLQPKFGKERPALRLEVFGEAVAIEWPDGEGDVFNDGAGKFGGAQDYQF